METGKNRQPMRKRYRIRLGFTSLDAFILDCHRTDTLYIELQVGIGDGRSGDFKQSLVAVAHANLPLIVP